MNSTNIKDLQEQRTLYKGIFKQDTYDCNHDVGINDNELEGFFFPENSHENKRGEKDRRDIFQREINQIYAIMNSLDDDNFDKKFGTTLQQYINRGRQLLRKNANSVKLTGVVNIMSKAKKKLSEKNLPQQELLIQGKIC